MEDPELVSPDGKIKIKLILNERSELFYDVWTLDNNSWKQIIQPSPLGIIRKDADFTKNMKLVSADEKKVIDDFYKMNIGNTSSYRSYSNERVFHLENEAGQKLDIAFRAFNEGVAFRYIFPEKDEEIFEVTGEKTGFNLQEEGRAWMQPYDTISLWSPAYEQIYENGIKIGTTAPKNKNGWSFPLLFESEEYWIYISEAGLDPAYCGSHLEAEAPDGVYSIRFPEPDEAYNYFPQNPVSKLPWIMPWRYIVISKDKGVIFKSNHVFDLSEPSRLFETKWVIPGKVSWSWWSDMNSPQNYNTLIKFIDFSAEMGWEYCLIDEGWEKMKGGDLNQLVKYARDKRIGLILWYESGGRIEYATDSQRKIMFNDETREREMQRISGMGVRGIKVDFFQSDKQGMIKLYYDILEDAMKYKLLVNFHGCTMPRGWSKTFPNLLSMEAIRGAESYIFDSEYSAKAPVNNTIIPFTRNVAGPMDYTPITLSDNKYPHITSSAHELALGVIFESGLQHFADHYSLYEKLPDLAREYLAVLPVVWDASMLIYGYPGKDIVIGRRKGYDWFIAGINGENMEKEFKIKLDFLPQGSFDFIVIKDGNGRDDLVVERKVITKNDSLIVRMNGYGGFCAKTGSMRPFN